MRTLEVCCYGLDQALIAEQAGAHRIELCAASQEGGITPSFGTLKLAEAQLSVPTMVMIRPRGGDFCYNEAELACMLEDIALVRELDLAGVVFGALNVNGELDILAMTRLLDAAKGLSVTFHRAFDMCQNPQRVFQQLADMGVDRILTSGQRPSALEGLDLLKQLHACHGPIIMPGCGIRMSTLMPLIAAGFNEFHSSASCQVPSPMQFINPNVAMSQHASDEYLRQQIDPAQISQMTQCLMS
ncbi:copper homeostasis protein CutC [Celerinatantimonas yamalensis]|uniref:PF03932 family protein CutC n=1 Tax=Celerinatantimonas yamalensis TaxID=559956 RepID=A0ABW9G7Z1_9GAMM